MDLKFEIKSQTNKIKEHYSYLDNSTTEDNNNFFLQQKIQNLEFQLKKFKIENEELKRNREERLAKENEFKNLMFFNDKKCLIFVSKYCTKQLPSI
jgi:hypothetical protein